MHHVTHLEKDKRFRKVLQNQDPIILVPTDKVYLRLCSSIISQQLSTKVAKVIYGRFIDLFNGKEPSPKQILAIPFETLKSIGLSFAKTNYIQNVCTFFLENKLSDSKLSKLSNEEIIELLTQIKGVGKWTVEMILMFTLGREDVFAVDDLGIQQAITKLYSLDALDKKKMKLDMVEISKKWSPYRTYACRYLWKWKDI